MNTIQFEEELATRGCILSKPDTFIPSANDRAILYNKPEDWLFFYDNDSARLDRVVLKRYEKVGMATYYALGQVGYAKTDVSTAQTNEGLKWTLANYLRHLIGF